MPNFFYSQLFVTPPKPTDSYDGKTVIVTGSNVGLGKEAARHFVANGAATVILAVRSLEKGEAARKDIEETTQRSNVVRVVHLDMSSYESVLSFADKISSELPRIDIAILNAGISTRNFTMFEKDESTITVNVVSSLLLGLALLPKLIATSQKFNTRPTLTFVVSEVHFWARWAELKSSSPDKGGLFAALADEKKANMPDRYMTSKLVEVLAVRALCEQYPAASIPVTINQINPGLCHSELLREGNFAIAVFKWLLARTTEVGSRTLVHAGSQGKESHGEYLSDCEVTPTSKWVRSKEGEQVQGRLWAELVEKLEAIKPGVTKVQA